MLSFPSADKATGILTQVDFNDSKSDIFLGSDEGHKV